MHWDDIKIFLYVARRKTLSAAAYDLKMDETTVSRRLKRLEQTLGQTLFERLRSGHVLTSHGENLLVKAENIERNAEAIRIIKGRDAQKPSGTLRISVSEGFGAHVLAPILYEFTRDYPDIEIDLVSGSGFLSLSKREADVAIGLNRSKSKHITSKLLTPYTLHLYGSRNYLAQHPPIKALSDLNQHSLIDYVDDLIYSDELRYFYDSLPDLKPQIRSTSIMAQKRLVETGAGLAILPDFLIDENYVCILPNKISVTRHFWFSTHQSVAIMSKVKVFETFIMNRLGQDMQNTP